MSVRAACGLGCLLHRPHTPVAEGPQALGYVLRVSRLAKRS